MEQRALRLRPQNTRSAASAPAEQNRAAPRNGTARRHCSSESKCCVIISFKKPSERPRSSVATAGNGPRTSPAKTRVRKRRRWCNNSAVPANETDHEAITAVTYVQLREELLALLADLLVHRSAQRETLRKTRQVRRTAPNGAGWKKRMLRVTGAWYMIGTVGRSKQSSPRGQHSDVLAFSAVASHSHKPQHTSPRSFQLFFTVHHECLG
jgi:hypothetical protein